MEEVYRNIGRELEKQMPFLKNFARRHPQFYGRPLMEAAEGQAFLDTLHMEYRKQCEVVDPLAEITLNVMEDTFIAPGENVTIHRIPPYIPAIMHYNEYFEIKYVRQGSCTYYTKESKVLLKTGDLIITPPKVEHGMTMEESDEVYNTMIRSTTFDTAFVNLVNQDDFLAEFFSRALYGSPADYILWHCGENQAIEDLVLRCYEEFYSEKPYGIRMVEVLLMELFVELLREEKITGRLPEIPSPDAHEVVRIVINYLQNHCADATLEKAAAICNYSERQMSRILKAELGYSFAQLRQDIRLKKACAMLAHPGVELKELALVLGFGTESYFGKVFRKEYGVTPREYRAKKNQNVPTTD